MAVERLTVRFTGTKMSVAAPAHIEKNKNEVFMKSSSYTPRRVRSVIGEDCYLKQRFTHHDGVQSDSPYHHTIAHTQYRPDPAE